MTALRKLAERWKSIQITADECADELLEELDAEGEGEGGAVSGLVRTAPEQIYLQISDDKFSYEDAFPANYGDEITWCADSVLDCEVKYIRSDITKDNPARSGGVSDEDVDAALKVWNDAPALGREEDDAYAMRAALEHFAKGEHHGR